MTLGGVVRGGVEWQRGKAWRAVGRAEEAKERRKQMYLFRMTILAPLWRLDGKKVRLGRSI